MKKVVGLIPLVDEERESLWMLPGYMKGLEQAGVLGVMLPLVREPADVRDLLARCDGLLLTGGHDVSPSVYGEEKHSRCAATSPERDVMEGEALRIALAEDMPVLGICRGIQFLNAALGGTLWQDLPSERPTATAHHQEKPYDAPVHEVDILPHTPLSKLLGVPKLRVNSLHHQAIKDLAPCLRPMAVSEDGLIEAVWHPEKRFLWAVQWHPEFTYQHDPAAQAVFAAFANAMR